MPLCVSICEYPFLLLQDAQTYAEENGLLFMETSAKSDQNVNELFMAIGGYSSTQRVEMKP